MIDVLRGVGSERILTWHHDKLSVYGVGADRSEQEWRAILRQVIALGLVTVDHEQFSSLKLTDAARPVLKGGQKVQLRQYQKPVKPKRSPLVNLKLSNSKYQSWRTFLDNAYWSVELK